MNAKPVRASFKLIIQILGWILLGVTLLLYQPISWGVALPNQFWIRQGLTFLLWINAYYLNSSVLVPRFLFRNKMLMYSLMIFSVICFSIVAVLVTEDILHIPDLMDKAFHPNRRHVRHDFSKHQFDNAVFVLSTTMLVLGISTSITTVEKLQADLRDRENLEKEKINSELSFLKAQINPHFFFNTLNNIYSLTLIDAEMARVAIHKLSRMMRYLLYETQHENTKLGLEVEFVKDYIEIMQLRLTDKVSIDFQSPSGEKELFISPMLFLPFIENAFEHGVSTLYPSHLMIAIQVEKDFLNLKVENTIFKDRVSRLHESSGIGLVNTRRRLDLLYPNKYTLLAEKTADEKTYKVDLKIFLN